VSIVKRVALVLLTTVVGNAIVFIGGFVYYQRAWLIPWQSLGMPPERAVRIVSAEHGLWVETTSGNVYQHKYDEELECEDECWELASFPESNSDPSWAECDSAYPLFINPVDTEVVCYYWAVGVTVVAYAIDALPNTK
jgi:hypothetical protein